MTDSASTLYYRQLLESRLAALESQGEANADARDTVMLDQSSVGRLSRMDALQQQAMAKATLQKREAEIRALHAALKRLEEGEYGYCEDCGEDIPVKRLELAPTATRCVACASG